MSDFAGFVIPACALASAAAIAPIVVLLGSLRLDEIEADRA